MIYQSYCLALAGLILSLIITETEKKTKKKTEIDTEADRERYIYLVWGRSGILNPIMRVRVLKKKRQR